MKQQIQIALIERVLAHLGNKSTDAIARTGHQRVDAYSDPDQLERERSHIFRRHPLLLGHSSELAKHGDFVTRDAAGVPVLIARDRDGRIGAFINVCRHRGTRVEPAACGNKTKFVCPYHAWTYGCDGRLVGIPHAGGFPERPDGLVRLPCAVIAGLMWVTADPAGLAPQLPDAVADDLDSWKLADHHVYDPRLFRKKLNWKLAIDIFLESYHLRSTHRESIYPMFFDNLGLVDSFGPHLRTVFPKRTIRELPELPRDDWRIRTHANVLYFLFPNTLILIEPDHAGVLSIIPDGPAATGIRTFTLVPDQPLTDKARRYWDANNEILYNATDEDYGMGESIQAGLTSGANERLTFGRFEHALTYFHESVDRALRGEDLAVLSK